MNEEMMKRVMDITIEAIRAQERISAAVTYIESEKYSLDSTLLLKLLGHEVKEEEDDI